MLQIAPCLTVCEPYRRIYMMPIQMVRVKAKSTVIRKIAVVQVSKRLQSTPWPRLRSLEMNNILRSHLSGTEVRLLTKMARMGESTRTRNMQPMEKSIRREQKRKLQRP